MVEHTIKNNFDALSVAFLYEVCKIRVVSKAAVQFLVTIVVGYLIIS